MAMLTQAPSDATSDRGRWGWLLAALIVAAMIASALWVKHERREDGWRDGGDAVEVHARVQATDAAGFGDALAAAGGERSGAIVDAKQGFVVPVTWTGTPGSDGSYQFVLLDDRVSVAKPIRAASVTAAGGGAAIGWDGSYEVLREHYAWLAGTAARYSNGSYFEVADAVGVPAKRSGSATLAYWFGKRSIPTTDSAHDLELAMFYVDSGGEVRWARDIPMKPLATVTP